MRETEKKQNTWGFLPVPYITTQEPERYVVRKVRVCTPEKTPIVMVQYKV